MSEKQALVDVSVAEKVFCDDLAVLFELVTRVLCDAWPRRGVDALYLFGQSSDNYPMILDHAARLYNGGFVGVIASNAQEAGIAPSGLPYPGFKEVAGELMGHGFRESAIVPLQMMKFNPSTDAEAVGFVHRANRDGWRDILCVAPPLHELRAFVSTVSAALKEGFGYLNIWSISTYPVSWQEPVYHSQTSGGRAPRWTFFASELDKMVRYCKKGDHVPAKEILAYMNLRDGRTVLGDEHGKLPPR